MKRTFKISIILILALISSCVGNGKIIHHRGAQINFQSINGDFILTDIHRFDKYNSDIAAQYKYDGSDGEKALITVYVYPFNKNNINEQKHFDELKKAITIKHKNAKLLSDKKIVKNFRGNIIKGFKAIYHINEDFFKTGNNSNLTSIIELYSYGNWLIKFRITYANSKSGIKIEDPIEDFKKNFFINNEF